MTKALQPAGPRRKTLLDKVKRNGFFIVAAFFAWQGWSSANATPEALIVEDGEEGGVQSQLKVPDIRASFLRGMAEDDASEAPKDPFGALQQQVAAMAELGVTDDGGFSASADAEAVSSRLTLRLESTMHANHSWIARINGHSLRVGESLPGFDENQPPVLVSVGGTIAKLRYNDEMIVLDLTGQASVSVD